ncbi:hypothetical protein TNCV_2203941 [Trichonephila clavipes]|nr:hypothetical protein TNCV_2203941 [Trichonephila clavipes]
MSRTSSKFKRPNTFSPGVQSIAGPSRLPDRRRTASTTIDPRTEGSGRDDQTRQTRATTRGTQQTSGENQSGQVKPLQGDLAHTIYVADWRPTTEFLRSCETSKSTSSLTAAKEKSPQYGSIGWRSST